MKSQKARVFLAIDSARSRVLLRDVIVATTDLEVTAAVADPLALIDGAGERGVVPDIAVIDAGFSARESSMILRRLLSKVSCPIISLGSVEDAGPGSEVALDRLNEGVWDVLSRPQDTDGRGAERVQRILASVRSAARCLEATPKAGVVESGGVSRSPVSKTPVNRAGSASANTAGRPAARISKPVTRTTAVHGSGAGSVGAKPARPQASIYGEVIKERLTQSSYHPRQVLLIGASTGGTEAISEVLQKFPLDMPGICIVQHIPPQFSKSFAQRLNATCAMEVREAMEGDVLKPGLALVAPGGYHMELKWIRNHYEVRLTRGPEEHHQRPAVDVLFRTGAEAAGRYALGVLLTGMGKDGALGMRDLRRVGAINLAQDEKSCVVYGMPAAAKELGVVDEMVSLQDMHLAVQRRLVAGRGAGASAAAA